MGKVSDQIPTKDVFKNNRGKNRALKNISLELLSKQLNREECFFETLIKIIGNTFALDLNGFRLSNYLPINLHTDFVVKNRVSQFG